MFPASNKTAHSRATLAAAGFTAAVRDTPLVVGHVDVYADLAARELVCGSEDGRAEAAGASCGGELANTPGLPC